MPRLMLLAVVAFVVVASPAQASEQFGDVDTTLLSLKVNASGEALVSYRKADGVRRDVLVWGAVNALAPDSQRPQVRFRFDYSGGWRTHGRGYARAFQHRCRPYDGPPLALLVAACTAPDGSYWAIQRWQRLLPMRGFDPFKPGHAAHELHLSHWSG
ncbi:MAG: hypothetical protein H0T10_06965, partial [Actinobacteria bacterium]|nr:hypothetical protein [Actinomycetota bacterium]